MQRVALILATAALVLVLVLWSRMSGSSAPVTATKEQQQVQAPAAESEEEEEGEQLETAVFMGRIQTYHQKFWAAGETGNTELATFYLHEMEEAMETIADGHVIDEGVDVSGNMRTYGLPMVRNFQERLKKEGIAAVQADQAIMANTCNSCHVASAHPFIRIKVPTTVGFPDQDFAPAK